MKDYDHSPGSMSKDARRRWYIKICAMPKTKPMHQLALFNDSIGIDLGLKDCAATGDGTLIEARKFYATLETKPETAQCANEKDRVKAIDARIANRRKDFHHKLGIRLVQGYDAIFVGNVNASAFA